VRRQRDLALLGPSITFDQFSHKMWDVITANQFYDRRYWSPGPLGRCDPVFQTLLNALWSMVPPLPSPLPRFLCN
jgi:hypothetical protein